MNELRNVWRGVWQGQMLLGEGPVWDVARAMLWFVDIKTPRIYCYDPATDMVEGWDAPTYVGWVFPCDDGTIVAGLRNGVARFDPSTGGFEHLVAPVPHPDHNRLNDATVAPDGTIWFGTMDDEEAQATGRIFRFDGMAVTAATIAPVTITNGPAVSPDGKLLYFVDTGGGLVRVAEIDEKGEVRAQRDFVSIDPADGHPDGVTVDSAGNIWLGLWGGWCARLYSARGELLREVRLPAANVTKVALGGPDLKTAYVTTARIGLDEQALSEQPEAGSLFAFDVEMPGQALRYARVGRR
ncbi:MAG: SMP-30/gluconolactonase/LRE family protein [Sphingomonas bacterium]|nr:SMP-30/gluconolactonase/LRE family protein [Sphingomonas bacterium]